MISQRNRRSAYITAVGLLPVLLVELAGADCDVTCIGVTFSSDLQAEHAQHAGLPVCGHEGCGESAPFIGLQNFGCSAETDSWDGNCCNQDTCDGVTQPGQHLSPPSPPGSAPVVCGGMSGFCGADDIVRRSQAVTAQCCDQPSEDCSDAGMPSTCNSGCASATPSATLCQTVRPSVAGAPLCCFRFGMIAKLPWGMAPTCSRN